MIFLSYRARWVMVWLMTVCGALALQGRADEWRIPGATIRFELRVHARPSATSAGYFVTLPDGGLLPTNHPTPHVFTADGRSVASYVMWHHAESELAIVFAEASGTRQFHVYIEPASRYRLWTPDSDLTPSVIKAVDPTRSGLGAARTLRRMGSVGSLVHYTNHRGVSRAPLSVGLDPSGRPRPAAFYVLAHVQSRDPGWTWIVLGVISGESEVYVNGSRLNPRRQSDRPGGTGDFAEIRAGPNRIEMLHSAPGDTPFETGLLWMAWRTPNATESELGGPREDGRGPQLDARVINQHEILRSGSCVLTGARTRTGAPVALLRHEPAKVFWFEDETPLLVYAFSAVTEHHSPDTTYRWRLPDGVAVEGASMWWIFPGKTEQRVELQAENAQGRTRTQYRFFTHSTRTTRLGDAVDRRDFRRALWQMVQAFPERHPAISRWDQAYWRNLLRTAEPGRGYPLYRDLFERQSAALARALTTDEVHALQDVFLDTAARLDARDALAWVQRFRQDTPGGLRRNELTLRAGEIFLHYLDDADRAVAIFESFHRQDDVVGLAARVQLGDAALMADDLNEAVEHLAAAQQRARVWRNQPAQAARGRPAAGDAAGRMEQLLQQMGRTVVGVGSSQQDWRLHAMLDATAAETVRSLLAQRYYPEAREALRLWMLSAPISRVSADQLIVEAIWWSAIDDHHRAANLLRAFCETVEASPYLPEAAILALRAMAAADWTDEQQKAFGDRMRRKLEFHPVAERIDRFLETGDDTLWSDEAMAEWYREHIGLEPRIRPLPRPPEEDND